MGQGVNRISFWQPRHPGRRSGATGNSPSEFSALGLQHGSFCAGNAAGSRRVPYHSCGRGTAAAWRCSLFQAPHHARIPRQWSADIYEQAVVKPVLSLSKGRSRDSFSREFDTSIRHHPVRGTRSLGRSRLEMANGQGLAVDLLIRLTVRTEPVTSGFAGYVEQFQVGLHPIEKSCRMT
jgi:hypothetical protein